MTIDIWQVDAFTDHVFGGNPAAVCILTQWPDDTILQSIAMENNLSETAFAINRGEYWDIRWFTPVCEIGLAGHPTLATAWVLFHGLGIQEKTLVFHTRSAGVLTVRRRDDLIVMDFPARSGDKIPASTDITNALGLEPLELYKSRDYMAVYDNEKTLQDLQPDFAAMKRIGGNAHGIIVTAPGDKVDFVSRFFAPVMGVEEDPVTGSAHCTLVPYWSKRLGKSSLVARQISRRRGTLFLEDLGDRVTIAGKAVLYLKGQIYV